MEIIGAIAAVIAATVGVGSLLGGYFKSLWRNRTRKRSFTMSFPTVDYPVAPGTATEGFKTINLGNPRVLLQVRFRFPQDVDMVNIRCVSTKDGGDVDPNIIRISHIEDPVLLARMIPDFSTGHRQIHGGRMVLVGCMGRTARLSLSEKTGFYSYISPWKPKSLGKAFSAFDPRMSRVRCKNPSVSFESSRIRRTGKRAQNERHLRGLPPEQDALSEA